jgi:hypothetical protein
MIRQLGIYDKKLLRIWQGRRINGVLAGDVGKQQCGNCAKYDFYHFIQI